MDLSEGLYGVVEVVAFRSDFLCKVSCWHCSMSLSEGLIGNL